MFPPEPPFPPYRGRPDPPVPPFTVRRKESMNPSRKRFLGTYSTDKSYLIY